jgi:acetoin utilization deacetylase AcuC-like enzyme
MNDLVFYYPKGHEAHFKVGHPERPDRIEVIRQSLIDVSHWNKYPQIPPSTVPQELLKSVHSQDYLIALESACSRGDQLDVDTYTTPSSWKLSLETAGGATAAALSVWNGKSKRAFALTRPPGHHATRFQGMGFCLLNNVAIAAESILQGDGNHFKKARKLAIIDLDLHHGNGTQDIFWSRQDVLYISTHQSPLYPGTGGVKDIGIGEGEGYTANFPLPPGTGDVGFRAVLDELIIPLLDRYHPEILLISFGFDPHWLDPLGHLMLSAEGYRELIRQLVIWSDHHCDGKIALFLEGGYDLDAGVVCAQAVVSALLGHNWRDPIGPSQRPEGKSWKAVVRQAHSIWDK